MSPTRIEFVQTLHQAADLIGQPIHTPGPSGHPISPGQDFYAHRLFTRTMDQVRDQVDPAVWAQIPTNQAGFLDYPVPFCLAALDELQGAVAAGGKQANFMLSRGITPEVLTGAESLLTHQPWPFSEAVPAGVPWLQTITAP